jgi:hypothetical protein
LIIKIGWEEKPPSVTVLSYEKNAMRCEVRTFGNCQKRYEEKASGSRLRSLYR